MDWVEMRGIIILLLVLGYIIALIFVYFNMLWRLGYLYKKENKKYKTSWGWGITFDVDYFSTTGIKQLFVNQYKEDKKYTILIWAWRILSFLFIVILIIFISQFINF